MSFRRTKTLLVQALLCYLVLGSSPRAMAWKERKEAQEMMPNAAMSTSEALRSIPDEAQLKEPMLQMIGEQPYLRSMEVTFDWTRCQIHWVDNSGPLEIFLNGTIKTEGPEILIFFTVHPKPGALPKLYFIEDEAVGIAQTNHNDATLNWALSLNDGPFEPMAILPDNSVTYQFPSGMHSFRVRISAHVKKYQANGYYQLQLSQSFVPLL